MDKKWKITLLLLLLMMFMGISGVFAYFTSSDQAHNYLSVGFNDVEIKEEFPNPDLKPGSEIRKVVKFINKGNVACYVRAKITFSSQDAEDISTLNINSEDWEKKSDGYYYYKRELPVQGETPVLLTAVKISEKADIANLEEFDLFVYAETTQSGNHDTPLEAFRHLER